MAFRDEQDAIFGRVDDDGHIMLLYETDGSPVTRLDVTPPVWPVGSDVGGAYEHPEGITITRADAARLGIDFE